MLFIFLPETKLQHFDIYLHNRNILKYTQIAGSAPKSMILFIKGRSKGYNCRKEAINSVLIVVYVKFGR